MRVFIHPQDVTEPRGLRFGDGGDEVVRWSPRFFLLCVAGYSGQALTIEGVDPLLLLISECVCLRPIPQQSTPRWHRAAP